MKTILITGASSGLGLSHAIYLTHLGYNVIGTSRNAPALDLSALKAIYLQDHTQFKFLDKLKIKVKTGKSLIPQDILAQVDDLLSKIKYFSLDITDSASVKAGVDAILAHCKEKDLTLDVLINNAGNGYFGSIEELPVENAMAQFNTNYFGQIRMIQAIVPIFRKQGGGKIINTSSMAGLTSIPFQAHYSASKAAILKLSESLRTELAPFNISVCTIVPGDINTSFNLNSAKLGQDTGDAESIDIQKLLDANPISGDSIYKERADTAWRIIIQNLIISPPPLIVSKKIEQLIESSKPKMHNLVSNLFQKFGVILLRRFMSDDFGVKETAAFYGLDL